MKKKKRKKKKDKTKKQTLNPKTSKETCLKLTIGGS